MTRTVSVRVLVSRTTRSPAGPRKARLLSPSQVAFSPVGWKMFEVKLSRVILAPVTLHSAQQVTLVK